MTSCRYRFDLILQMLHLLLWAFWNFGRFVIRRFVIGRFLHWALCCIGRFFALGVVFFDCFVFGCFVLGCFVPTSYFSLFLPEYFLFNFVYFFFGDSIRKLNIGFSSCTILTFWQEEASKIVDGFFFNLVAYLNNEHVFLCFI